MIEISLKKLFNDLREVVTKALWICTPLVHFHSKRVVMEQR